MHFISLCLCGTAQTFGSCTHIRCLTHRNQAGGSTWASGSSAAAATNYTFTGLCVLCEGTLAHLHAWRHRVNSVYYIYFGASAHKFPSYPNSASTQRGISGAMLLLGMLLLLLLLLVYAAVAAASATGDGGGGGGAL